MDESEFLSLLDVVARRKKGTPVSTATVDAARHHLVTGETIGCAARAHGLSRQRVESFCLSLLLAAGHDGLERVPKKTSGMFSVKVLAKKAGVSHVTITKLIQDGLLEAKVIQRSERTLYQIPHEAGYAYIVSQAALCRVNRTKYPLLTPLEFAVALHTLCINGAVKSDTWIPGVWEMLVNGLTVTEAAALCDIPSGSLTRTAKKLITAAVDPDHYLLYQDLGQDCTLDDLLSQVMANWQTVRQQRIIDTKARRALAQISKTSNELMERLK